jgi:hypothetical protein
MADPHKSITSTTAIIATITTTIVAIVGGLIWIGTLNANVSELQRRVAELEKRAVAAPAQPNPVAAACIGLAKRRAETDQKPGMTSETEKAMNDLGCMRLSS